jgi:integrase
MRALLQGMDERQSWDRYLRNEGESSDLRTVRRTIAWIRDEFATAARRAARPGTARLILIDAERLEAAKELPTLEEFAAEHGLEDFSFAEQAHAYAEAYPAAASAGPGSRRGATRRARLVERQLEALRWLEAQVGRDPQPGDGVEAWLNPAVAQRLASAGLPSLGALVAHINAEGGRWWRHVPGVGEGKAARVVQWLRAQPATAEWRVGDHACTARAVVSAAALDAVVPRATALVPLEKLQLPLALDGHGGTMRAPPAQCCLPVADDLQAIAAWLAAKAGSSHAPSSATYRAYRKEAERLLLWAVLVRGKPMSSLVPEDAQAYMAFLAAPPASWCGPRHHQRWSPRWRPLEGSVSPHGQRHAWAILKGLFAYLVRQRYLVANAFAAAPWPLPQRPPSRPRRALTTRQWAWLEGRMHELCGSSAGRRLARALRWLHATGLRPGELTAARCADLMPVDPGTAASGGTQEWALWVSTSRGKRRRLAIPRQLVDELQADLARHGFAAGVFTPGVGAVPILARHEKSATRGWTASGLAKAIKVWMGRLAGELGEADATILRHASAQWFRHDLSAPAATLAFHHAEVIDEQKSGRGGLPGMPTGPASALSAQGLDAV